VLGSISALLHNFVVCASDALSDFFWSLPAVIRCGTAGRYAFASVERQAATTCSIVAKNFCYMDRFATPRGSLRWNSIVSPLTDHLLNTSCCAFSSRLIPHRQMR
jgi:hypothetical protein